MLRHLSISVLLAIATAAVYWDAPRFEFVNYDDGLYASENSHIRDGLTAETIRWSFSTGLTGNWIPLTWLSLALDTQLFGTDAWGYHLTNVVLHAANAILLYAVLVAMTGYAWRSGFVAALFAVHPLHVESVAWISERKDVLSTFFGFIAMLAYVKYAREPFRGQPGRKWLLLSLLAFVASLLAKPMLVTLPFLLLILDFWPLQRLKSESQQEPEHDVVAMSQRSFPRMELKALVAEKIPFLVLTVICTLIAAAAQERSGAIASSDDRPLSERTLNAAVSYVDYLRKTVWPDDLAAFYPYPKRGTDRRAAGIAAVVLLAATAVAIWQVHARPYLLMGWLWYLGTLVPVIGLVPLGLQRMADRYTYFPLIGPFLAVVWLLASFTAKPIWQRFVLPALGTASVIAFGVSAHWYASFWHDSVTLFMRAVSVTDENAMAYNLLGQALRDRGDLERARDALSEAIAIQPNFTLAYYNLAQTQIKARNIDGAAGSLQRAIELDPDFFIARIDLGDLERERHNDVVAVEQYRAALKTAPQDVRANVNLANLLLAQGQIDEAIALYRTALKTDPDHSVAHSSLGSALFQQGKSDEAISHFRAAVKVAPESVSAHLNLGIALRGVQQTDEAISEFEAALRLDPENQSAKNGMAESLADAGAVAAGNGQLEVAAAKFNQALELNPKLVPARFNLVRVYRLQNRLVDAERELRLLIEQQPELAAAHHELGRLLLDRNQRDAAIKALEEAERLKPGDTAIQRDLARARMQ